MVRRGYAGPRRACWERIGGVAVPWSAVPDTTPPDPPPSLRRSLRRDAIRALGVLLGACGALLALLGVGKPMSPVFWGWVALALSFSTGCWLRGRARRLVLLSSTAVGGIGFALVLAASGPREGSFLLAIRTPNGEPLPRWTSLVPERDTALATAPFVTSSAELDGLLPALDAVYGELEGDVAYRRTTQPTTLVGGQTAERSDAFMHMEAESSRWVIFLHGFGGNAASGCWVVATAAAGAGWSTLCPSTSVAGTWGRGDGPAIFDASLRFVAERGARDVVVAGYSNGAAGALQILEATERREIVGLFLLSGFDPRADASSIRVPTLIVSGAEDSRFDAHALVFWVRQIERCELLVVPGADHMLLVKRRPRLAGALQRYLRRLAR